MKKTLGLVIAVSLLWGCNREKNKLPDLPRGFSVEVNGAKWMGTSSRAKAGYTRSCYICPKDSTFDIEVQDTIRKNSMHISVYKWPGKVGSYNYPNNGSAYSIQFIYLLNDTSILNTRQYVGVLASLNITKLSSDNVQGTFWAKMVIDRYGDDTIIFTNGVFNLPLE